MKRIGLIIYKLIYYFVNVLLFKKIYWNDYISLFSTITDKSNKELGKYFVLRSYSQIHGSFKCGDYVRLGYGCHVFGDVIIGNYVMIAPNVVLAGGSHGVEKCDIPMIFQDYPKTEPIIIGDDVWIGANSVVLKGVNIGDGVIVGAGSVVTKDIPSFAIVVGNPAKIIKYRE